MPPSSPIQVSIILPVFNEAGHLASELDRIRSSMDASGYAYEVLVVDDGSTDGGVEEIAHFGEVRLVSFSTNKGSGTARAVGTTLAKGEIVVWTDADMSYPNDQIPELISELRGWDMVVGARRTERGSHRLVRQPAKWLIRMLACFLSGTRIPDLNSGFRAFRRPVGTQFLHLLPSGFSCVTTLTMCFLSNGYGVRYTPIDYAPRAGVSKFHWWKDTVRYIRQVVRMVILWDPLRFFAPLAVLIGGAGAGKLVYDLATKDFRVANNTVVLLMAAALVLLVALLTDLLVQLNRPQTEVLPAYAESGGETSGAPDDPAGP